MTVTVTRDNGRIVVSDPRREQLAELKAKVAPQYRPFVESIIQERRPTKAAVPDTTRGPAVGA